MPFNHIFLTFLTYAFNFRQKLFLAYYLINFSSTGITCVHCNLNTRFYITTPRDNPFNRNQRSNRNRFNFSHISKLLFTQFTLSYNQSKVSFEFRWNSKLCSLWILPKTRNCISSIFQISSCVIIILPSLHHHNIMRGHFFIIQCHRRLRDDLINH